MSFFNQVALRDDLPFGWAASASHSRFTKTWDRLGRWAAVLLVVAASGRVGTTPALAAGASAGTGTISFYGDIGNDVGGQNPLLVRPATFLLTEDGSVALVHLKWSGWGASVAQATGEWSASDGVPDQAEGKRTISPVRLTLSSPGLVAGHRVYRCFQIDPPAPAAGHLRSRVPRTGRNDLWIFADNYQKIIGESFVIARMADDQPSPFNQPQPFGWPTFRAVCAG